MTEFDKEDMDFEDESEGLRNQRQRIKELQAELKSEREARQATEAAQAEMQAQARQGQVASALASQGLPAGLASVFPADREPTTEAVKEWAKSLGVTPGPLVRPEEETAFDRYNRIVTASMSGSAAPELGLFEKSLSETAKAYREDYKPTPEDWASANAMADTANRENRRMAQQVQLGRAEQWKQGFGGLTDPPPYADRTREVE